jgi:hypothetical protein
VTGFERPAPDISKIVAAWQTWLAQGEDTLPGRTMADLKIGGTDRVLETLVEANAELAPVAEAWNLWERGKVGPDETLEIMTSGGFAEIVEALAADV